MMDLSLEDISDSDVHVHHLSVPNTGGTYLAIHTNLECCDHKSI